VNQPRIVIIDDDKDMRETLASVLSSNFEVLQASMTKTGMLRIVQGGVDAVLLDIRFGREADNRDGLELLEQISLTYPELPVLMMTGHSDLETALRALKAGAMDFIQKDRLDPHVLTALVESAIQRARQQRRVNLLERNLASVRASDLLGDSDAIREVRRSIEALASDGRTPVLIHGESGTGKEVAARAIHKCGPRSKGEFVTVSVNSFVADSIERELFGVAESGSAPAVLGMVEQAKGGVLFLDGISELPLGLQGTLLRLLDDGTFQRVGSAEVRHADLQVISATQDKLEALVDQGRFRKDLYFRLRGYEINMPPLRTMSSDVSLLAEHFLHQLRVEGRTRIQGISGDAIAALSRYRYPGNVRELKSVVEQASIRAQASGARMIQVDHLRQDVRATSAGSNLTFDVHWDGGANIDLDRELAMLELCLIDQALSKNESVQALTRLMGLPHRHALGRRLTRLARDYPDLLTEFPRVGARAGGADASDVSEASQ